jgi:hypothetical protein
MGLPFGRCYWLVLCDRSQLVLAVILCGPNAGWKAFAAGGILMVLVGFWQVPYGASPPHFAPLAEKLGTAIVVPSSRSVLAVESHLGDVAHPLYVPEHVIARLEREELERLACYAKSIPRLSLFHYSSELIPIAGLLWHPEWTVPGLVLLVGATRLHAMRGRIRHADVAAAQEHPRAYISGIARAAWIHQRPLDLQTLLGRLVGIPAPMARIDEVAAAFAMDRAAVEAIVAQAQAPPRNPYPLPPQVR